MECKIGNFVIRGKFGDYTVMHDRFIYDKQGNKTDVRRECDPCYFGTLKQALLKVRGGEISEIDGGTVSQILDMIQESTDRIIKAIEKGDLK